MQSLANRCDLRACDTFLRLFHSGPDVRIKELRWGIQAFSNAVGELGCEDYEMGVIDRRNHLLKGGTRFSERVAEVRP